MKTRIQKWGNSLAVRIPKSFANEIHLQQDSLVEVSLAEGKLVLSPLLEPKLTLSQLLEQVNEHNLHHEAESGPSVGDEMW